MSFVLLCKKKAARMLGRPFCGLRFAIYDFREPQIENRKSYFLMNVFVTVPSSVVTRTKYMPLARP